MTKLKLFMLMLMSVLLVSAPHLPRPDATPIAPADELAGLNAESIARVMGEVNPLLSMEERSRIGNAVLRYSTEYAIDPELVMAVILVESAGRPWAHSPKGALGLMQVMPYMRARMARAGKGMAGNLTTIESNIEAGCWILAENIQRLGEEDGVSSYFWGTNIRSVSYLNKVRAARTKVRRLLEL